MAEEDDMDDDDDEEEATAEVAFLAALGEAPGVAGIDLSESSYTSMISKLSWLSVLVDLCRPFCPELLDSGHDFGPVFVEELSVPAISLVFPICSQRFVLLEPQRSEP